MKLSTKKYRYNRHRHSRRDLYVPYTEYDKRFIIKIILVTLLSILMITGIYLYLKNKFVVSFERIGDSDTYNVKIIERQPEKIDLDGIMTAQVSTFNAGPLCVEKTIAKMEDIGLSTNATDIEIKNIRFDYYAYIVHKIETNVGNDIVSIEYGEEFELIKQDLPSDYYGNIDFSSFQPIESYDEITNKRSPAYKISHSDNAYTDENGFRRYKVEENDFSINGEDDYIVALGTFYKTKGNAGERFLIITSTGSFTVIAGDEKSDNHTDPMNMFTRHGKNGSKAGIIEYIVDTKKLDNDIASNGTATAGPVEEMTGEIQYIYKIEPKDI